MKNRAPFQRLQALPLYTRYIVVFALGAAAALAFAPYYAVPLLFIAFPVLLLLAADLKGWRSAAGLGWWFGFGHFLVGLHWIGNAFQVDAATFGWMEYPAVIGLSAMMAFYPALALALTRRIWQWLASRGIQALSFTGVLAFALLWSGSEWLRGHLFTGFPWNLIGYIWGFSDAMLQPASLFGIYGLSLVTILILSLPAVLAAHGLKSRQSLAALAVMAGLPLALFAFGLWTLSAATDAKVPGKRLRLVQTNIDQREKWNPDKRGEHLIRYLVASARPGEKPITDVIWPETAISYFIDREPSRRYLISGIIPSSNGYIITGAPRISQDSGADVKLWNSLFVMGKDGEIAATYDKFHLVPFGEYLPFRKFLSLFGIDKLAAGDVDFSSGPGPQTIRVNGLPPFSPLVCYEIIFPGQSVNRTDRPDWILNITNDAWFGDSTGPYQHLVAARTRAIEEGLPVVRVAGTGISAFIDPYGRVRSSIPLNQAGIVDGDLLSKRAEQTLYTRIDDWSYFFFLSILAIGVVMAGITSNTGSVIIAKGRRR